MHFLMSSLNVRVSEMPHLTIQGPFDEKVPLKKITILKRRMKNDVLFIGNPGLFETDRGVALFLRIASDNLARVWFKPDYPIEKYGFNPHITIYEGKDITKASKALEFLKKNRVELLCREFDIVQYVPKQFDMFPMDGAPVDESAISKMMARGKLSSSFRASFLAAINADDYK
jgi:hypothetical protein